MNITDEMLYAAAPEAAERWLDTLPRREDCGHDFSLTFEASMDPLLRRRRRRWRTLVLLAAVIAGLAGLLTLGASAGRPDDYHVYAAQEEGYAAYRAIPKEDGAGQSFHQLTPEWLPEGFVWTGMGLWENRGQLTYRCQRDPDRYLFLLQWHGGEYASTLMGNFHLENVRVTGEDAIFFSNLDTPEHYLLWTQGTDAFLLTGVDVERGDMIRFADSLKW